ncbi:hypothetical protein ACOZ4N_00550 (plasmid) [Halorientalis pallida]|uniref:hypothetical protein n=1 Tax=Halorientalis pallida TaxID=2479928 RepID=UPI003C6FD689
MNGIIVSFRAGSLSADARILNGPEELAEAAVLVVLFEESVWIAGCGDVVSAVAGTVATNVCKTRHDTTAKMATLRATDRRAYCVIEGVLGND